MQSSKNRLNLSLGAAKLQRYSIQDGGDNGVYSCECGGSVLR